ncbi:MAG: hypothetical protein R3245_01875, partial [Kiloniellales bacterium]|nr:hypothetical protein [Kiloniellales bacterium]
MKQVVGLLTLLTLLIISSWSSGAIAQVIGDPNSQLVCWRTNQEVYSPGLNTSYNEGQWGLCAGILDGNSLE